MSLRITEAFIKRYETGNNSSKEDLAENRLKCLSESVTFANYKNSDYLVIRGEIADLLSITDEGLLQIKKVIDRFTGAAILVVADLNEAIIANVKRLICNSKLFFFADDQEKNLKIPQMLAMIDSLIISNDK